MGSDGAVEAEQSVEPVIIHWQGTKKLPTVRLPTGVKAQVSLENHGELKVKESAGRRPVKGTSFAEYDLHIPNLSTGYHWLSVDTGAEEQRCLLLSAPRKLYSEGTREWGAFLPLYAAHSESSWGAGNLSDWSRLAQWIGQQGGRVVGTLPILAAFLDRPVCEPSPYSPASRLFWNEFFIDVTALPEFAQSDAAQKLVRSAAFQKKLNRFRQSEFIDYREEWGLRRTVLEILSREFFSTASPRRNRFREYARARPELDDYAAFRAACDRSKKSWHTWDSKARGGRLSKADYDEEVKDFYRYIQWAAQEQIEQVLTACGNSGVKFYLDLPLGVNPDGFDAWRFSDFFARQVSAGAPPDAFFTKGQDWGFAPLDPLRTRQLHYRYVIDYLRFQMRHTGLLRIDHVMGLHRLWWVPHGFPASAGAYVRYPAEELYAILSIESHLHKTKLVGENLGTVPPEVNKGMDQHGLRKMFVLQYEQRPEGVREPQKNEVASVNTHDMPSFAAHWEALDIADRHDLGLIPTKDLGREKRHRARLKAALVKVLRHKKLLPGARPGSRAVLSAALQLLARSSAETILVTLEDLWSEERSQNVPGTSVERPNWRRKSKLSLEQIMADPDVKAILAGVNENR